LKNHWEEAGEVRLPGVSVSNLEKDYSGEGIQLNLKCN